jgi:hypothetical protein
METIGRDIPEYLVDYRLLVAALAGRGLRPPTARELPGKDAEATGPFEALYAGLANPKAAAMSDALRRYSFLNRWFVFVKAA